MKLQLLESRAAGGHGAEQGRSDAHRLVWDELRNRNLHEVPG